MYLILRILPKCKKNAGKGGVSRIVCTYTCTCTSTAKYRQEGLYLYTTEYKEEGVYTIINVWHEGGAKHTYIIILGSYIHVHVTIKLVISIFHCLFLWNAYNRRWSCPFECKGLGLESWVSGLESLLHTFNSTPFFGSFLALFLTRHTRTWMFTFGPNWQ